MADEPRVESLPIPGGRIERLTLPGGPGRPLVVVGGVETGLRPLAGTEAVHRQRWEGRRRGRSITIVGRPVPDDPSNAAALLHPRACAAALAVAVDGLSEGPVAVEAESGGGRISLWLTVDYPELVGRLVLVASASETAPDSKMAPRMAEWIAMAEAEDWGRFFAVMAIQLRPGGEDSDAPPAASFDAASKLQPRPATPERFVAELRATMDPSSFVTDRLGEIGVPVLVLACGGDQVVPLDAAMLVAERIPGARLEFDPTCGHTVRNSFRGYDRLVETFLAEGDARDADGSAARASA